MKKWHVLFIVLLLLCTLAACSSNRGTETSELEEADMVQQTDPAVRDESQKESQAAGESHTEAEASETEENRMKITVGDTTFTASLADNSSTEALLELLQEGPLTIAMSDYGKMEKVGPIGQSLPENNEQITTEAGDIILYQGNSLVIYYDTNSWNFTRIGKINGVTQQELKDVLGSGNVTVIFELEQVE